MLTTMQRATIVPAMSRATDSTNTMRAPEFLGAMVTASNNDPDPISTWDNEGGYAKAGLVR